MDLDGDKDVMPLDVACMAKRGLDASIHGAIEETRISARYALWKLSSYAYCTFCYMCCFMVISSH